MIAAPLIDPSTNLQALQQNLWQALGEIGIESHQQLQNLGAIGAYLRLLRYGKQPSIEHLYLLAESDRGPLNTRAKIDLLNELEQALR